MCELGLRVGLFHINKLLQSFLLPSRMPSDSPEIEDVSGDLDGHDSIYLTTKERRKQRRREASRRHYASNSEIRERKRLQMQERRAQAKAKKRRWDPPKKPKAIVRDDPTTCTFPSDDENLLASEDEQETQPLTYDEMAAMFEADMRNSEGASASLDNDLSDSADEQMEKQVSTVIQDVRDAREMSMQDLIDEPTRAQDETTAAEMLVHSGSARGGGNTDATVCEGGGSGAEMAISREPSKKSQAGPAIVVSIETTATAEYAKLPAPHGRVFRGYRYIPSGPAPAHPPRQSDASRPNSSGICGNCKNPEKCEKDGNDGKGLCERCMDCTVWGYLCWDHFNGLKEWEEPWLW
ncbi:hypothetical protein B0H11DRAFT_1928488 [Mycena galericulata]|nr:hypothetical protein B0H11DRAFT_1928488 [Mycena galericulata]